MNHKILIIEDNENNLYLMTYILEQDGYEIIQARDGSEGIKLACGQIPSLIILDIQLPLMDGFEVARKLRSISILSDVPIVAVTSYAMAGDREKILAAGCTGYMRKPINTDTFSSEIGRFLAQDSDT
jgi:CheY-like chemotaxis protein